MKTITIIDLEWNSWKFNYNIGTKLLEIRQRWQHHDILQLGAINYDPKNYEIKDKLSIFIRPKFNPKLNNYIIKLLKIDMQSFKKNAISFRKGHNKLINFTKNSSFIICNGDDNNIYKKNINYNGISDYRLNFFNIRNYLKKKYFYNEKKISSPSLHNYTKNNYSLRPHDAVDDAISILYFLKDKKESFSFSKLNLNS